MKRPFAISLLAGGMLYSPFAAAQIETGNASKDRSLDEVVVTGTRNETDAAQLSATVSVIDRKQIEQANTPSLLPILTEQVPGLFVSSRGIMGYGVSGGAAGEINLRGISGSSGRLMVLIDGHPQYMGLMGHPIADAYQSLMAEKVEVLRGPASVLYGRSDGRSYQYHHQENADRRHKHPSPRRLRFIQHAPNGSHQPYP